MKKMLTFLLVIVFVVISVPDTTKAQVTPSPMAADSIIVAAVSFPTVNLVGNDNGHFGSVKCYSFKVTNNSNQSVSLSKASIDCRNGQYISNGARLDLENVSIFQGTTVVGGIGNWSISDGNNNGEMPFYFLNPVVVAAHSSIILDLKADLFGWGTFHFILTKMTVSLSTEVRELKLYQNWGQELTGHDIILANVDHLALKMNVWPRIWNDQYVDTLYVLPSEYFYSSGNVEIARCNYLPNIINGFRAGVSVSQNLANCLNWEIFEPWLDNLLGVTTSKKQTSQTVVWTSNSTAGIDEFNLSLMSGNNNLPVGESATVNFFADVVFTSPIINPVVRYESRLRIIKSIDGVLGDFDGDGLATWKDKDAMQEIHASSGGFIDYYYYVQDGPNIGRNAIFFDGSSLVDLWALGAWLNNDPSVQGLGIGEFMSKRIKPTAVGYTTTANGNTIKVNTTAFAVRISAQLADGKQWSSSTFVSAGQAIFTVPDKSLNYKIEAVALPKSTTDVEADNNLPVEYSVSQNYPNPFNPTTSISYALPKAGLVKIQVYDILARLVDVLLEKEMPAGKHQIKFDASRLSSGTYICRVTSGEFTKSVKMILMK